MTCSPARDLLKTNRAGQVFDIINKNASLLGCSVDSRRWSSANLKLPVITSRNRPSTRAGQQFLVRNQLFNLLGHLCAGREQVNRLGS